MNMVGKKRKRVIGNIIWSKRSHHKDGASGAGQASTYHALVVIFLEFFAWGLLTSPVISILNETFPKHTFLMNGLIQGVKGMLSFLSAPLIGALSDVWGRKPFLLLTVTFTCAPIPLMHLSVWWYFAMLSISGIFSVTFSVVFAFVADVTTEEDRSAAYGLVSATFAASLVTSPALGAYLQDAYSETVVIWIATAVALLDIFFIMVAVPESLPEKIRPASWGSAISWDKADPFGDVNTDKSALDGSPGLITNPLQPFFIFFFFPVVFPKALRKVSQDQLILLLCTAVFLSYLPEAGEYSSIFVYLKLVMDFTKETVASYIAMVGVLSVVAQTFFLSVLMKYMGHKHTIMIGLMFEIIQLSCYGFATQTWILWMAGCMAAMSSITYPGISAFVSSHASADQQGVAQGIVTGIRGLCNGLGPALFGCIFYLFHVNIDVDPKTETPKVDNASLPFLQVSLKNIVPGPPFAFGAVLVIMALLVAAFIPSSSSSFRKLNPSLSMEAKKEPGSKKHEVEPLMAEVDVQL